MPFRNNNNTIKQFTCIFLVFLLFQSCKQKIEGCLDILANNFDITAEENCCCTYPTIRWNVAHKFNGTDINFLNDSLYINNGTEIFFDSLLFYVSDLKLIESTGEEILSVDESEYVQQIGTDTSFITLDNAWGLLSLEDYSIDFGSYMLTNTVDAIQFRLGLDSERNLFKYNSLDEIYRDDENYLEKSDGTTSSIYLDYDYNGINRIIESDESILITLPLSGSLVNGSSTNFTIYIDYAILLDNIDWANDSDEAIINQMLSNANSAFF